MERLIWEGAARDVRWQADRGGGRLLMAVARNRRKLEPFYSGLMMTDGAALRRRIWGFVRFTCLH